MGAEQGFRKGPCMVDILLFPDKKVRSKERSIYFKKKRL